MTVLKIFVLLSLATATFGKSVKLQFEFEDILKLLPYLAGSNHVSQVSSTLARSAKVRAEPTQGRFYNPYHPEDNIPDAQETVPIDQEDVKDEMTKEIINRNSKLVDKYSMIRQMKARKQQKVDLDIEKDNDNFIKDKQSISEDELTDFANDVAALSTSVQKITKDSGNTNNLFQTSITTTPSVVDIIENPSNNQQNTDDDRSGFKFLQRRFVKKTPQSSVSSQSKPAFEPVKDADNFLGFKISENEPVTHLNVSENKNNRQELIIKANNVKLGDQSTPYDAHVVKRNLAENMKIKIKENKKYFGFVINPESKVTKDPAKYLTDPAEQDMKLADNIALKEIEKSADRFVLPLVGGSNDGSVMQKQTNINKPSYGLEIEKKKYDNSAFGIPILA